MSLVGLFCKEADDDGCGARQESDEQREVHVVEVFQDGGPVIRLATTTIVVINKR